MGTQSAFDSLRGRKMQGKTYDPFGSVRPFIEERQHPVTVLLDIIRGIETKISRLGGNPVKLALLKRDLALVKLISAKPFRPSDLSLMTFIPKDESDLRRHEKIYVETEDASSIYMKSDGSFWVRSSSTVIGMASEGHARTQDIPVPEASWDALRDYLFTERQVINRAIKDAINRRRIENGWPLLSPQEEQAIAHCPYVFRPSPSRYVLRVSIGAFARIRGAEPMFPDNLNGVVASMGQQYLVGCKNLSITACGYLMAAECIKNFPRGYEIAAGLLNLPEAKVRKLYAWVPSYNDKSQHLGEHHLGLESFSGNKKFRESDSAIEGIAE